MKSYPKLSVIFPIHNGWEDTQNCLASLKKSTYPQEKLEIIIINNASKDNSVKGIQTFFPEVKLINKRSNLGFAKAVNLGIKESSAELILITNNDVIFEKNCLKELVKTFASGKKIGVVGGRVIWKNKGRLCIDGFRLNPFLAYHQHDLSGQKRARECDWISGNCLLTTGQTFRDLGGFDEKYFFYFEDIDLCLRARGAGWKILYCPTAIAYHVYGKTIFKENRKRIFYLGYRSRWRCVLKNASPLQIITSSLCLLTIFPAHQSWKAKYNTYFPMLKGLLYNLKHFKNIKNEK